MPEVNVPVAENTEDPAYVDAMVAKARGEIPPAAAGDAATPTDAAPTDGKPEWLGDFETPEAMAQAYNELRTKMSQDGAPKADAEPEAEAETPDAAAAAEATEAAGIDMSALESEFSENGALSDATYETLSKAGFDKNTVDAYIAGQQALGQQLQSRIEDHVGGADKLEAALQWAQTGMSQADQAAFNNAIDKADEAGIKLAMDGLMAKFNQSEGSAPNLIGGTPPNTQGEVFRSTAELTAAMGDPRYTKDPAYRSDVEAKLARSSIFRG